MSEPISLGAHLRYPITISRLVAQPGDDLQKGSTAMEYSFKWIKEVGDSITGDTWEEEQTTISSWGSPVEGKLKEWKIRVGDVIHGDKPCVVVEEACQHPIQISGLCAICGKDMTEIDWSTERLTVSRQQALKVETELQHRLLEQRKLSLVVDLDQTIIHACIDPTVGEWQKDPTNPNYEAIRDVRSFQLEDDGPRGVASGCYYYIKMRPGLREFLEHVSQLFELHVYTMGTRAYAMNIAKIVDPDQKLFGNRVISRDENGNMTAKSLQRLFPRLDQHASCRSARTSYRPTSPPRTGSPPAAAAGGAADDSSKTSALEGLAGMSSGDDAALLRLQQEEQERTLEKQLQDRPLLHAGAARQGEDEDAEKAGQENQPPAGEEATPPHHRHQVLLDDDSELRYLEHHLTTLHSKYYEAYDSHSSEDEIPDVGEVLDELKAEVLRGTKIVLSGLVPLGMDVYRSEVGMQVLSFGADLRTRIDPRHHSSCHQQQPAQDPKDVHPADRNAPIHLHIPGRAPSQGLTDQDTKRVEADEDDLDDSGDEQENDVPDDLRSPIEEDLKGFDFEEADGETNTAGDESDNESSKSEATTSSRHLNGLSPGSKRTHDQADDEPDNHTPEAGHVSAVKRLRISKSRGGSSLRMSAKTDSEDAELPDPGAPEWR
ncbi:hypothetical protein OPQ81_011977 [Rhizoctonia solani]|nr:hypothetical protein OPQ81_011977 [Rhizoctonia solani]